MLSSLENFLSFISFHQFNYCKFVVNYLSFFHFQQVLNLFAAIIIDNFDYFKQDKADFGPRNLVEFFPLWAKLDDDNT
jgi:hypothetical protein